MYISNRDIKLIAFLLSQEKEATTTQLAKEFFNIKDNYTLIKKDAFMRSWLERFRKLGIVERIKNTEKTAYSIRPDKVMVGKNLFVNWKNKEVIEFDTIALLFPEFGWVFFEMPKGFALASKNEQQ